MCLFLDICICIYFLSCPFTCANNQYFPVHNYWLLSILIVLHTIKLISGGFNCKCYTIVLFINNCTRQWFIRLFNVDKTKSEANLLFDSEIKWVTLSSTLSIVVHANNKAMHTHCMSKRFKLNAYSNILDHTIARRLWHTNNFHCVLNYAIHSRQAGSCTAEYLMK